MPEGPEVRRMTQDLAAEVSERTLVRINVLSGRYTKKDIHYQKLMPQDGKDLFLGKYTIISIK